MTKPTDKSPYGAFVQTWGTTKTTSDSGMLHYVSSDLFGGNVGHSAIELRLPVEQIDLVKLFCDQEQTTSIPYKIMIDEETGVEYIAVRFSWWPGRIEKAYISHDLKYDRLEERDGVSISPNQHVSDESSLDEILIKGRFSKKKIRLGLVAEVLDAENLEEKIIQDILNLEGKTETIKQKLKSLEFLCEKYDPFKYEDSEKVTISLASKSHIKNLLGHDTTVSNLLAKVSLTKEEVELLQKAAKKRIQFYKKLKRERKERIKEIKKNLIGITSDDLELQYVELLKLQEETEILYKTWLTPRAQLNKDYSRKLQELSDKKKQIASDLVDVDEKQKKLKLFEKYLAIKRHKHLLLGKREDASVCLPLDNINVTAMLEEMRSIADKEAFHIKYMNCSSAVMRILAAGVSSNFLRSIAQHRAWGFFANPQQVYNAAIFMQQFMTDGYTWIDRLTHKDFLMVSTIIGYVIKKYIFAMQTDGKNTLRKAGTIVLGIFLSPVIALLLIIKNLANPTEFIKDCFAILKMIYVNNCTWLKLLSTVVLLPPIAIHSLPALIENFIKLMIFSIIKVFGSLQNFVSKTMTHLRNKSEQTQPINGAQIDLTDTESNVTDIADDDYQSLLGDEDYEEIVNADYRIDDKLSGASPS